jgi:hypothetical protein
MMDENHDKDCECGCKKVSPSTQQILQQISDTLPSSSGVVNSKKTVDELKGLSTTFGELGGIDDIIAVAEEFFKSPETATKESIASKVDITTLKSIEVDPPVLKLTKTMNFGFFSTDLTFAISAGGFTWLPVINQGIETKEQALESLKGVTSEQPVNFNTPLEKAKQIATETYSLSREVADIVATSSTIEDFLNRMGEGGYQLLEEVDIYAQMKTMIEEKSKSVPTYSDLEEDCGAPPLATAPFTPNDLKEVEKDCCLEAEVGPTASLAPDPLSVIPGTTQTLSELRENSSPTQEDQDKALDDVNTFTEELSRANQVIQECAKEKQNALNSYYLFYEASHLNELANIYTESRMLMLDALTGAFDTLLKKRQDLIEKAVSLRQQETDLLLSIIQTSGIPAVGSTGSVGTITLTGETTIGQVTQSLSQAQLAQLQLNSNYREAGNAILQELSVTEDLIQVVTDQISDQKANFTLPTFTDAEILNLQTYGATFSTLGESGSILVNKTRTFKQQFLSTNNPVSNQVGFLDSLELGLYVHPYIYEEAKTLFSLHAPPVGEIVDYVKNVGNGIPLSPIGATSSRLGLYASEIWNKYYSNNRVDLLFTYLEQGYTSPKPRFNDSGQSLDPTTQVKIKGLTGETTETVSETALNLGVDPEIAQEFWENLERKTREKIIVLFETVRVSPTYQNYTTLIRAAAENEAKYAYAANLIFQEFSYTNRAFDNYTNSFSFNQGNINNSLLVNINNSNFLTPFRNQYSIVYEGVREFQKALNSKMETLEDFMELKKKCIADQEKGMEEIALSLAEKTFGTLAGGEGKPKDNCKSKLGSDPYGLKVSSGCPSITKNCYWKEYTKLMQIVSLMPIPDTERLMLRLFRYYPVAIQIPVPSPAPIALPTLASGLPDIAISIPMPIIWKHIITLSTPVGIFVTWVTLCGPIPGVYVMYIDENMNACFLVTPKGPIKIPAGALGTVPDEEKSLVDYLSPIKETFKVPLVPPFSYLLGASKLDLGDPDSSKSIIDKIQEKIKSAANSIPDIDFQIGGLGATGEAIRKRVRDALRNVPPDIEVIQEALDSIETAIDQAVDGLNISSIKIPKNPKKLATPVIGISEFMEDIDKLLDSGVSLGDLGLDIKFINLREEVKKMIDRELSDPDVKQRFLEINQEIRDFESSLVISPLLDEEAVRERVKKIKKALKEPIQKVADKITPEMLGFIALVSIPIPLPVPCYDDVTIAPIPPYILALIAAIKALPALIDGIPEDAIANALSQTIDLTSPLPTIEDVFFFVETAFLQFVPNLSFPDISSIKPLKQIIQAAVQNFFKIKIRLPKLGAIQITIPSSMIKEVMKTAIKVAFAALVAIIIRKLLEAEATGDIVTVLAVVAIIKAALGTDLASITGNDIKAFIVSSLESIDEALEDIQTLIDPITKLANIDFKSIKEQLFPFPLFDKENVVYLEISTKDLVELFYPLLDALKNVPLPFPLVLLGCSVTPTRLILTKLHPFSANQKLPSWEQLSLSNVPFVIWLDQLIATAQKQGGLGSNYLLPYWAIDAP